jgi:hypothetical protein
MTMINKTKIFKAIILFGVASLNAYISKNLGQMLTKGKVAGNGFKSLLPLAV